MKNNRFTQFFVAVFVLMVVVAQLPTFAEGGANQQQNPAKRSVAKMQDLQAKLQQMQQAKYQEPQANMQDMHQKRQTQMQQRAANRRQP